LKRYTRYRIKPPRPSAIDSERVYVYFGSYGAAAYTHAGELAWKAPLPIPKTTHGAGGSPVLAGDLVLLTRDQAPGAEVLALSKKDGALVWRAPLKERKAGPMAAHSSPVIWKDQALIHGLGELVSLNVKDGSRLWWVSAYTSGTSTPVIAGNTVYVNTFSFGGNEEDVPKQPTFAELAQQYDRNEDGKVSKEEIPDDLYLTSASAWRS
jgi:outer membrane protein assembly factor BamB